MVEQPDHLSYPRLLKTATGQLFALLRADARLAQEEMKEKASDVARSGAMMGGAALFALLGGIGLLQGLIVFLIYLGIPAVASPFVIATAFLVAAAALYFRSRSILRHWTPLPQRTLSHVRSDIEAVKEGIAHASR